MLVKENEHLVCAGYIHTEKSHNVAIASKSTNIIVLEFVYGPYLVLTRLALIIGYGLFIINELILMEVLSAVAVASSKRSASSIVLPARRRN